MSKIEFGGYTQYTNGGYSVNVNQDGSILVQPGDSLSKYSMAIYGDFHHLDRFLRMENGSYKEIVNYDLIHIGEKLYHKDVVYGESLDPGIIPPGSCPTPLDSGLSQNELAKRIGEILEYLQQVAWPLTDWEVRGSAGGSIGVDTEGIKVGGVLSGFDLYVARTNDPNPIRLRAGSIGGSFGVDIDFSPISLTLAPSSFDSGGIIFKAMGAGTSLEAHEFDGAFLAFELSGSAFIGGSIVLHLIGMQISDIFTLDWKGPARALLPVKAAIGTAGFKVSAPDFSVSVHGGYMMRW